VVDVLAQLSPQRDLPAAMELKRNIHDFLSYLDIHWDTSRLRDTDDGLEIMRRWAKISPEVLTIASKEMGVGIDTLRVLARGRNFVTWLRGFRVDAEFSTGVEMAMGRSEMECPPELWTEKNGSGRPDEEKLSMLTSVRNFLYRWIYADRLSNFSLFGNFNNVMRGIALLGPAPDSFASSLEECIRLLMPLTELLSDDDDNTAPSKLLQLLDHTSKARWVVSIASPRSSSSSSSEGQSTTLTLTLTLNPSPKP
jgi:hypothetical protein